MPRFEISFVGVAILVLAFSASSFPKKERSEHLEDKIKDYVGGVKSKFDEYYNSRKKDSLKPSGQLDYPNGDQKKLKVIQKMWDEYYDCLATRLAAIGDTNIIAPRAAISLSGEYVRMECNLCVSPESLSLYVDWYFSPKGNDFSLLAEGDVSHISPYDYSLSIYYSSESHSGTYYCQIGSEKDSPYYLQVLPADYPIVRATPRNYSNKIAILRGTKIVVYHDWTEWTDCSLCGPVGKSKRVGYCTVTLQGNMPKKYDGRKYSLNFTLPARITSDISELLSIFVDGIPCASNLLPYKAIAALASFPTIVMTKYCKVPCPEDVVIEIVNDKGEVIEQYNSTAVEHPNMENVPGYAPAVERVNVLATTDEIITIMCPGNHYSNATVEWKFDGNVLKPGAIDEVSKGRIHIDMKGQLNFKPVKLIDNRIFTCWQNRELSGIVHLFVEEPDSFISDLEYVSSFIEGCYYIPFALLVIFIAIRVLLASKISSEASKSVE